MTTETGYNGWTNYETWVAKLWIDNDQGGYLHWHEAARACIAAVAEGEGNPYADDDPQRERLMLAERLKDEMYETTVWENDGAGLASDLLTAAFNRIEWNEIAQSILDDAREIDAA